MGWLAGWRRGKQLYTHSYHEELLKLEQKSKKEVEEKREERIDELVQRELRERRRYQERMLVLSFYVLSRSLTCEYKSLWVSYQGEVQLIQSF